MKTELKTICLDPNDVVKIKFDATIDARMLQEIGGSAPMVSYTIEHENSNELYVITPGGEFIDSDNLIDLAEKLRKHLLSDSVVMDVSEADIYINGDKVSE